MQTLLIVDDEPNIVEGLASQFEQRYGDSVIIMKSFTGEHALNILQGNKVDVILSDVRMPDIDGLELIQETERLWPRTHFIFLSGFDDFEYIHRASKFSIYRGYLLKTEGDEVVMEKVDKEIRMCAEELRAETEQGRMRAFAQRAALESMLRGGGSWRDFPMQDNVLSLELDTGRPVFMVLGKFLLHQAAEGMQVLQQLAGLLEGQAPGLTFELLLPEEGTLVWLLQEKNAAGRRGTGSYIHALFEAIQQQIDDACGLAVSMVIGCAAGFDEIVEKYGRLNDIYYMIYRDAGKLIIVDETDYSDVLLNQGGGLQERFQFSTFIHQLGQQLHTGTPESVRELFALYFGASGGLLQSARLHSEQQLTLFTLLLSFLRENRMGASYEQALAHMLDDFLHGANRTEPEAFMEKTAVFCGELCRQRAENEAHNTEAVINRINLYIEAHIEDYNLSLTELARMTGFNPSYLSRLYRTHAGRKLSEYIDEVKLRHAQGLILSGELVKNVAERTGFASPSAFILFFKRNTGRTPRQFFEEHVPGTSDGESK